jgi:hypothetical protein
MQMSGITMWLRINRGSLRTRCLHILVLASPVVNLKILSWHLPMWEGGTGWRNWSERARWRRGKSSITTRLNRRRCRQKRGDGRAWRSIPFKYKRSRFLRSLQKRLWWKVVWTNLLHRGWWINCDICRVSTSTTLLTTKSSNLLRMFSEIVFSSAKSYSLISPKPVFQKRSWRDSKTHRFN